MVSFAVQNFFSLIRSHLFIFIFVSFLLETDPKNIAMIYVLHIFLQNFTVFDLTFRSLILLGLVLYMVLQNVQLNISHVAVLVS